MIFKTKTRKFGVPHKVFAWIPKNVYEYGVDNYIHIKWAWLQFVWKVEHLDREGSHAHYALSLDLLENL